MIDTHCHLTDPRLGDQLDHVFALGKQLGVTQFITIGTGVEDSRDVVNLVRQHTHVYGTVGIHPNYCAEEADDAVTQIESLVGSTRVVAIGECGLDYHYDRSPNLRQRDFFIQQLELARKHKLPVVVHCREAVADTLAILHDFPTVACDFHCFTGTVDEARQIASRGYMLGFTGPITFKKNDLLRDAVRVVPQEQLLVETDAPYLSPEPKRGEKINQPAYTHYVAHVVAQVRGWSIEECDQITTANAHRFFGIR
jgi:TatD DNase family protein